MGGIVREKSHTSQPARCVGYPVCGAPVLFLLQGLEVAVQVGDALLDYFLVASA
jgi:hypothetical protein